MAEATKAVTTMVNRLQWPKTTEAVRLQGPGYKAKINRHATWQ